MPLEHKEEKYIAVKNTITGLVTKLLSQEISLMPACYHVSLFTFQVINGGGGGVIFADILLK